MGAPNLESFQITVWYSTLHAVPDFMGALFVSRGSGWPLKSSSYEGDTLLFLCYPSSVPCGMHCGLGARHLTSSKGLPIRLSNIPCNKDRFSSICTHKFLPLAYKYSVGSAESSNHFLFLLRSQPLPTSSLSAILTLFSHHSRFFTAPQFSNFARQVGYCWLCIQVLFARQHLNFLLL
ncbi:hypothetical protein I3842_10G133700 [Carya illinoinensis]|uniref:Uncharacterized protein n=1 Tax=Carya illinoinensis TaxID=32201 RepID=A0A922DXN0_CARIL|nr:hypothetical protein I3842_10G133700 [Carya illinoinensis]KAG6692825.1 hypothetical protein I3842_10G133700 [Carya illinoinensis]KAG6692826.1 hypothetical protein I3842_10G133700 [Carya illinoinensis]